MTKIVKFLVFLSVSALFAGCATLPKPYNSNNPIKKVAVLPMKNDTLDIKGPDMVRGKMEAVLRFRGYNVKPIRESDQILRDQMGINLGGQLDMTTPQKLGEALGVDGVLYGTLMDFNETTTGLYNVKKVRGKFKLVNTATAETVWERGLGVKSEVRMSGALGGVTSLAANINDARDAEVPWLVIERRTTDTDLGTSFAVNLGSKLVSKAVGIHLEHEAAELAERVTSNLPWGPGPDK